MMERLVEQKSAINLYFDENESEVENLTNQDYKSMVDLRKLLEPLEQQKNYLATNTAHCHWSIPN